MARPKTPLAQRLWAKVQKGGPDECWPWLGARTSGDSASSYGRIRDEDGLEIPVHYAVWWETHGPLPPYHRIRHTCDDPFCCNPAHLELYKLEDEEW